MSLPLIPFDRWASGTNANAIPANDNSLRSEILSSSAISHIVTAQPALSSPAADGKWYVIPAGATGAQWSAFAEDSCAIFYGGTWYEFTPVENVIITIAGDLFRYVSGAWVQISGVADVESVNGQTGVVVLEAEDIDYDNTTSGLTASDVQAAIDELAAGGGGGGGGGTYAPGIVHRTSARYFFNDYGAAVAGFAGPTANRVYYYPFVVGRTLSGFSVGLAIATGAVGKARIGIYANDHSSGQDRPGTLIEESADINTNSTATDPFATTLSPGTVYWIGAVASAAPQIQAITTGSTGACLLGRTTAGTPIAYLHKTISAGWSALPDTSGTLTEATGDAYLCPFFTF